MHIAVPVLFMFFLILANGPMWFLCALFCNLLKHHYGTGDCCNLGGFSILMVGVGVGAGVGGIGQSFLVSNRFSEADPALGQGIPCLTGALGMSSTWKFWVRGWSSLWGLAVGQGTSTNCPVAHLYTITSIDVAVDLVTGVQVEVVATVGGRCCRIYWSS